MAVDMLDRIRSVIGTPEAVGASVDYVASLMRRFLRPGDKIMICFPQKQEGDVGSLMVQAARKVGAIPLELGEDKRWKTMLRDAFRSRASAIAAPPLVTLGLTKLAKLTKTPLYFRNVICAGYFTYRWMIEGIKQGLDCNVWGLYDPGQGAFVAGASCEDGYGVHTRDDVFTFDVVDDDGNVLPEGESGGVVIGLRCDSSVRFHALDRARISTVPCSCGLRSPRLMDIGPGADVDALLLEMGAEFHTWTSILDCRIQRGDCGLELELITFPGEKIPKLPTVARLSVRPWNPETDVPNWFMAGWRNSARNS